MIFHRTCQGQFSTQPFDLRFPLLDILITYKMKALVIETERAWRALGKVTYGPTEAEKESLAFRRSLYIAVDMKKGDIFNKENLRIIRPGLGLPPKYFDVFLGRKVNKAVKKGTAVSWDLVD